MDASHDLPDSTDWLNTPLADFSFLENALHCQICKEFYDTPMITSCNHTFCSKCIRTSISNDGKCPACRTADQASKLRNNWALGEVVAAFLVARPEAIKVARKEQEERASAGARRPEKRKRVQDSDEVEQEWVDGRTTRSKSRRIAASQTSQPDAIEIEDSDVEDVDRDFEPEEQKVQDDGLVECPLGCSKRMKIEQVEPHLDRCEDEQKQVSKSWKATTSQAITASRSRPQQPKSRPQERIAELNYSLLKDTAMRKKLEEAGIPGWGTKQLMVKRHTEWVNLWNANCDSNHPRSKRDLLGDLDTWERTQGGRAPNSELGKANAVMRKDFDGDGWAGKFKDDFSRLIADARRQKSRPDASPSVSKTSQDLAEASAAPALDGSEGSSPFIVESAQRSGPLHLPPDPACPYANDPAALASLREKVAAVNAGHPISPKMNEGFRLARRQTTESAFLDGDATQSNPFEVTELKHPAMLRKSKFGNSRDEHSTGTTTGEACDLQEHLSSSPKKMPMFAMPAVPISDVDSGSVGGG